MVVPKGGADSGVETRLPVQVVTLGRLGPDSNPRKIPLRHLVVGVGLAVGRL